MTFFLASHSLGSKGAFDYFVEYLRMKDNTCISLVHPLDQYEHKNTTLSVNGRVVKKFARAKGLLKNYCLDTYLTITSVNRYSVNVFIGANNLDTVAGILGKLMYHKNYTVIYFASDYSKDRFHNYVLDGIYTLIERVALRFSDIVISNTFRAENKRFTLGLSKKKSIVIPNTVRLKRAIFTPKRISPSSFIYVGNITKGTGLIDCIRVLKPMMRSLVVIGDSPDWQGAMDAIREVGVQTTFFHRKSHDFVINYLQSFKGFGLAPYDDKNPWTYYGSSLKLYEYIVTGVPAITSTRTEMSAMIKQKKLGIVYRDAQFDIIKRQLQTFNTNAYHKKAKSFYESCNPELLYRQFLKRL